MVLETEVRRLEIMQGVGCTEKLHLHSHMSNSISTVHGTYSFTTVNPQPNRPLGRLNMGFRSWIVDSEENMLSRPRGAKP